MKISALMSVYNGESYIKETIDSVLNQSYRDFEFIIVNDGSTDRTKEILDHIDDERIRIFHLDNNAGIPVALNYGIKQCKADYIIKVDADDIQYRDRFEKQLKFMIANPDYALSKTLFSYFPDNKSVEKSSRYKTLKNLLESYKNFTKTPSQISQRLKWYCCISHSTIIIKREVLKRYLYNNLPLFEDYDLFYRMNEDGLLMGHLDELLVKVRVSQNSTTVSRKELFDICAYEIKQKVLNNFKRNSSIYIWGAGKFGQSVLRVLLSKGWKVQGFIDSNNEIQGTYINGYLVSSPNIIDVTKKHKIIITSQPGMFHIIDYLNKYNYLSETDFVVFR